MEYNLQFAEEEICGGEARVHLLRWRLAPGLPAGGLGPVSVEAAPGSAPRALGIPVGMHVAVKVYHCPRGGGRGFIVLDSDRAKADEGAQRAGRGGFVGAEGAPRSVVAPGRTGSSGPHLIIVLPSVPHPPQPSGAAVACGGRSRFWSC